MNRDALLATLIGLALGLTITAILIIGPGLLTKLPKFKLPEFSLAKSQSSPAVKPDTSGKPTAKAPEFSVTSPLSEAIVTDSDIVVSGSALPGSTVVVSGVINDDVATVGAEAKFAGKITLTEGKNDLTVTQYQNGKPTTIKIIVYYTQENL